MLVTLALVSAIAVAAAQPGDTVRVDAERGSRVWIEGGSNVHDWSCRASSFEARVELASGAAPANINNAVSRVSIRLSVRDLKCGNRRMDHDLYDALKSSDPANPAYIIGLFDADTESRADGEIDTRGALVVAGVERAVRTRISTRRETDGSIRAVGTVPLLMTDFGVRPPTGLFGLIRSKNEIVVRFDLHIAARP
jgi:hypothetical protein